MALKTKFLHRDIKTLNLSKKQIIIGFLLGIYSALLIYIVLYLGREFFRLFTFDDYRNVLILTESEVNFFNLFFAYLAVIFGQSIVFSHIINRSRKFKSQRNKFKKRIVHDQRFLNLNFFAWFLKLSTTIPFFLYMRRGGFVELDLYSEFWYIFVLVVIALFLHSWINIRQAFFGKSLKWMLINFVLISILAFGISRINLYDYKYVNENILSKNIAVAYNLKLPESEICTRDFYYGDVVEVWVVKANAETSESEPSIFINRNKVTISDMDSYLYSFIQRVPEYRRWKITVKLYIDSRIQMKYINQVFSNLLISNLSKIEFAAIPKDKKEKNMFYNFGFRRRISYNYYYLNKDSSSIPPPPPIGYSQKELLKNLDNYNLANIKIDDKHNYTFNDSLINIQDLEKLVTKHIQMNISDYLFLYHISKDANFEEYFRVIEKVRSAVQTIRDEYCKSKYGKSYNELLNSYSQEDEEKAKEAHEKYPEALIEIPE